MCISEAVPAWQRLLIERSSMGQKWPGSSTPAVVSHWLAAGERGSRWILWWFQAVSFLHSSQPACCPWEGHLSSVLPRTLTPQNCYKDHVSHVCAAASSAAPCTLEMSTTYGTCSYFPGEKAEDQRGKVTYPRSYCRSDICDFFVALSIIFLPGWPAPWHSGR